MKRRGVIFAGAFSLLAWIPNPVYSDGPGFLRFMNYTKLQWWERFQKYYTVFPELGLAIDLSRMNVGDAYFTAMEPKIQKAFADMAALEALGISHIDCLASCDAVITKPGYGTIVEAACHAIPTLFVRRGVWPEEPALVDWLVAYGTAREISRAALECGALAP